MLIHTEATPPLLLEVTLRHWLMGHTCRDIEVIGKKRGLRFPIWE